jgi:hypothetical protein
LKTFVTQIEPALPLTSDPPVKCFWNWIRWKYYEVPKDRNLESVSAKNRTFFSPTALLPTLPRQAHTHPADGPVHVSRFFRRDLHGKGEVSVATRGRRGPLSAAARRCRWISRSRRGWRGGPGAVAGEQGKAAAAPHADHLLAAEMEQGRFCGTPLLDGGLRQQGGGRLEARPLP